jgi:phosphogluconate dehydratase
MNKNVMNKNIAQITQRIIDRSAATRRAYLEKIAAEKSTTVHRASLSCGNLAHGFAACGKDDKATLRGVNHSDVAIISAYNDMLSAHQPYQTYPEIIKAAIKETGGVAQFAGGVPAMCDGVTQGQPGMDLSLMSRDVIAMSSAVALSHNMFDGALMLGICDKIVPGLMIASMTFGHLPTVFVPAGPMPSGIPNKEKARVRQQYAQGEVGKEELLAAESASYHSAGTCTFFGTANSNQLVVEVMGLHLPGASFVAPNTPLREELTKAAARQVTRLTQQSGNYMPVGRMIDERSIVNAIVALLATGGSTNLTMHIISFAKAAGIIINFQDFNDLSDAVPLLTRIYPNGHADINHFQQAGGMALLFKELIEAGLVHEDVETICGRGLTRYTQQPILENGQLKWIDGAKSSGDPEVIATAEKPFKADGGLKVMKGNLGVSVLKTSSLQAGSFVIKAPAVVFEDQHELDIAFNAGELDKDFIAVVRFQGPKARGMPELHKLTPPLGVLQDKGYKVALVTDGRMSGASGKVPAAIHLCPEALDGGLIAKINTGDMILLDGETGQLTLLVDEAELLKRENATFRVNGHHQGMGRELFGFMRRNLSSAETGACSLFDENDENDENHLTAT